MPLSDVAIRNSKPAEKQYKIFDEGGLYIIVRPSGGKLWRLKYRYGGKELMLSLGTYPTVGLREARDGRDAAKKNLASGIDPGEARKKAAVQAMIAAANTFKEVAAEYSEKRESEGLAPATLKKTAWLMTILCEVIGKRPVSDITPAELLGVLKAIERRGKHETAGRARSFASRVFRYAVITGRATYNPAADLAGALITPKTTHRAAVLDPQGVGKLLGCIDIYDGGGSTQLALRLAAHVFVRPGELRTAEWSEFDLDACIWKIPASKTKMRKVHEVPLSRQSLIILREAEAVRGHSKYVFPAVRTWLRPMSNNTLNAALRRMGYTSDEMSAHGFRAMASTLLNESGKWSPDGIERALAHSSNDSVRAAYHRGAHWAERVEMAQWWSDYLDQLRANSVAS